MHCLDQDTFLAVIKDAWQQCAPLSGMEYYQLFEALMPRKVPCVASVVEASRSASIRFLEMAASRKGYVKRIVEL